MLYRMYRMYRLCQLTRKVNCVLFLCLHSDICDNSMYHTQVRTSEKMLGRQECTSQEARLMTESQCTIPSELYLSITEDIALSAVFHVQKVYDIKHKNNKKNRTGNGLESSVFVRVFTFILTNHKNIQLIRYLLGGMLNSFVKGLSGLGSKGTETVKSSTPISNKRSRSNNSSANNSLEGEKKRPALVSESREKKDSPERSISSVSSASYNTGSDSETERMEESVKEFHIVHRGHPVTKLEREQVLVIMDELGKEIDNTIKTGGVEVPLFDRHFIKEDRLVLKPENDHSSSWLKDLINRGLTVEDFPSLKIITDSNGATDRTKWFKYTVRITDDGATKEQMYSRLKSQNSGLISEGWKIIQRTCYPDEGIVWLMVLVPENAHKFLMEKKGYMHYGMTKLRFVLKDNIDASTDEYVGKRRRV